MIRITKHGISALTTPYQFMMIGEWGHQVCSSDIGHLFYLLIPRIIEETIPYCFLTDPLWKGINGKHIRVALGPKFGGGNRIGYTKFPLQFDKLYRPSQVAMYWTDNKGKWQQGDLPIQDLTPARPTKSKISVVVIGGDRKGQVFQVAKVTKADKTVLLVTASTPQKELAENVCIVEDHLETGCTCSHLPRV
jgi:hypothetical protein